MTHRSNYRSASTSDQIERLEVLAALADVSRKLDMPVVLAGTVAGTPTVVGYDEGRGGIFRPRITVEEDVFSGKGPQTAAQRNLSQIIEPVEDLYWGLR
jgi:hypothetical protein